MAITRPCKKTTPHMPPYYRDNGVSCHCPGVE